MDEKEESSYQKGWHLFVQLYLNDEPYGPYLLRESDEIEHMDVIQGFLESHYLDVSRHDESYNVVGGGYFRNLSKNKRELQPEGDEPNDLKINEEHLENICKKEGSTFERQGKYYIVTLPDCSDKS